MNILPNTIKLLSLLSLFCQINLSAQCCKKNTQEYMLVPAVSSPSIFQDDGHPDIEAPQTYLRKAPPTKWQQRWTIFKYVSTGTLLAGLGVGTYFLVNDITSKIEQGANSIESDFHSLESEIGKLTKFTESSNNMFVSMIATCPEQVGNLTSILAELTDLISNCSG